MSGPDIGGHAWQNAQNLYQADLYFRCFTAEHLFDHRRARYLAHMYLLYRVSKGELARRVLAAGQVSIRTKIAKAFSSGAILKMCY
jgi:hypothetical protein